MSNLPEARDRLSPFSKQAPDRFIQGRSDLARDWKARRLRRRQTDGIVTEAEAIGDPVLLASGLIALAGFHAAEGDLSNAEARANEALRMLEDDPELAGRLRLNSESLLFRRLGYVARCHGDLLTERRWHALSLLSAHQHGLDQELELALVSLAEAEGDLGNVGRSAELHAHTIWRRLKEPLRAARSTHTLSNLIAAEEDWPAAIAHAVDAVELSRTGPRRLATRTLRTLIHHALEADDLDRAASAVAELQQIDRGFDPLRGLNHLAYGELALANGHLSEAKEWVGLVEQNPRRQDAPPVAEYRQRRELLLAAIDIAEDNQSSAAERLALLHDAQLPLLLRRRSDNLELRAHTDRNDFAAILAVQRRINARLSTGRDRTSPQQVPLEPHLNEQVNGAIATARTKMLHELLRQKAEVADIISHDLQGALAVSQLAIDLLDGDNNLSGTVTVLAQATDTMASILDVFGVLTNLDTQRLSPIRSPEPAQALALDAVAMLEPLAKAKGQTISTLLDDADGVEIMVDRRLLDRVLTNLISNAVKFSPLQSTITVEARVPGDRRTLYFDITDAGPGISPEHLTKVFGRLVTGPARPTGGERSLGLGLYLAHQLCGLMGASLSASSDGPGTYSVFSVEVPTATVLDTQHD